MSTITVSLPDDRLHQLKELASRFGVTPEELVRISVEDLLTQPSESFQRAVDYVLDKNPELYQRLSK